MTNLVTLLGIGADPLDPLDHYARIRFRHDPQDEARGLSLRSSQDPAQVPVVVTGPGDLQFQAWLTADGCYSVEEPGAV